MEFSESEVIAELSKIFTRRDSRVLVGIGDDAAVVTSPLQKTVITTDMAVEDVHFRREWSTPEEIGEKITSANLADVFAMGATPEYLVVSISLTGNESIAWIKELARGIEAEARSCDVLVIGGDVVRGPVITISITAMGQVDRPILRTGSKVGDEIVITNLPGWSALGLYLLQNSIDVSKLQPARCVERALAQFRAPSVQYSDAMVMRKAHAMCDISDGLLVQANQMATKTKFVINSDLIRLHSDFADLTGLAAQVEADVWDWIAGGGEDHAFLATGINLPGFVIGKVEPGIGVELLGVNHTPKGYRHFT
jgi:thiamine-monophosphate kinase